MASRNLSTTLILIALLSVSIPVLGQQKKQQDGALLPDINPQDIEIRGQFKARFPGLNRQPILGFDPSLQIYQIDPNRQPFMETGDQIVANLPISNLSRPAPPDYRALQQAENSYLFSRVGVGSYTSPMAKLWVAYPVTPQSYVGGDLDLSSSDGYLDKQPTSFRFLTANGEYGARIGPKMDLKLHGGLQSDFNHPAEFSGNTLTPDDRITYQGANGGAELSRFKNAVAGWKLQGNIRSFNTTFDHHALPGSIDEVVYNGSFASRWALGSPNETFAIKAGARGGSYDPESTESQSWSTLKGGIAYEGLFNYQTRLHAEADVYYGTDINEDKVYPGALVQVDHWLGNRIKITGKAEAKPYLNTVEQLHERNRFLGYDNNLIHTYSLDITGELSIKYYRGSKLHGGVTYTNAQNYAYFLPQSIPASVDLSGNQIGPLDYYQVNYQDATNFKLFAGITHQLMPERFWISAEAYVQHPELKNGDKIPFQESWGLHASASARPINRITLKGWADYLSKRKTGINNNEVDGFFLVGSQLDVQITQNFGAYLKLVNMLGQKYQVWQGYQERPFQVYGGLTLKL